MDFQRIVEISKKEKIEMLVNSVTWTLNRKLDQKG